MTRGGGSRACRRLSTIKHRLLPLSISRCEARARLNGGCCYNLIIYFTVPRVMGRSVWPPGCAAINGRPMNEGRNWKRTRLSAIQPITKTQSMTREEYAAIFASLTAAVKRASLGGRAVNSRDNSCWQTPQVDKIVLPARTSFDQAVADPSGVFL